MLINSGNQHTLQNKVKIEGRGLHSGAPVSMTVNPANPDSGFVFCRKDLPGEPSLKAGPELVIETNRATTLGEGRCRVGTVEHFLAAAAVLGLDNLKIEINGPEMPILDGSAQPIYSELKEGGIKKQRAPRIFRKIEAASFVREGLASLIALPWDGFRVTCVFIAPPPIGRQVIDIEEGWEDLLPARTFGWAEEARVLKEKGLAKGAGEDCALLIKRGDNAPPYRIPDEPVCHKVLDLLGDLALYRPIRGHIIAVRAGHKLHNQLARKLQAEEVGPGGGNMSADN